MLIMRISFIIILMFAGLSSNAQQQDVQKAIESFFEAFHQKDTIKLKSVCSHKLILQSISESVTKGNKLAEENINEF
jgi:hypothetical protein